MIHPTAVVSSSAVIGPGVDIGPFTIIHDAVEIGAGTRIDSHCEIGYPTPLAEGEPLIIGAGGRIRSHSVFYQGSSFGDQLTTGHRVTVRERTRAGANLQIGTLGDIQGHCQIGDYVRMHSSAHIGQSSVVGNFVWIYPFVVLTNDPHPPSTVENGVTVEDYAVVATTSVVLPGVKIGSGALVAAHSLVNRDVEPNMVVAGSPAKAVFPTERLHLRDGTDRVAYPWRSHFHRGYPETVVAEWLMEFPE